MVLFFATIQFCSCVSFSLEAGMKGRQSINITIGEFDTMFIKLIKSTIGREDNISARFLFDCLKPNPLNPY